MKFDVLGRINNMRLPDGKTAILYSVYEAVSNSIHSINDRFGDENAASKGKIDVNILLDSDDEIDSITITDNGIGFTQENIESFQTSDSRFKYKRGGKGVGRLIWIKMFESIKVDSVFEKKSTKERVRFIFLPEKEESIFDKQINTAKDDPVSTTITLSKLRTEQRGKVRPTSYLKDLALHFFPQYISGTLPEINVIYKSKSSNLNEFISSKVDKPITDTFDLQFDGETHSMSVSHMFVDTTISANLRNSYLLTAHGRLVGDPISIELKNR